MGHLDGGMERPGPNVGLRLKIEVFPGDTNFLETNLGVSGSLIIIMEALGRMRFSE